MLSGDDEIVYNDMLAVVDWHSALAVAGVIVEARPRAMTWSVAPAGSPSAPAPTTWSRRGARCRHGTVHAPRCSATAWVCACRSTSGRFRTLADVRSAAAAGAALVLAEPTPEPGQRANDRSCEPDIDGQRSNASLNRERSSRAQADPA